MPIEHISDTARWVAIYRAMETDRPDAIFRDPFARRLAGESGQNIVDNLPSSGQMSWAIIVRTALIDELVLTAVREGADLVVNLAAGLDTRPWRLALPAQLRWVDVDLPGILDHKTSAMAGIPTTCRYEAVRLDLADVPKRQALLSQFGASSQRAVVITEGLLVYLTEEAVASLATDLHAQPSFRSWILDMVSPDLLRQMKGRKGNFATNTMFKFAPANGTDFFRRFGWAETQFRSFWTEAKRLNRQMRMSWIMRIIVRFSTARRRAKMSRLAGVVVLKRD